MMYPSRRVHKKFGGISVNHMLTRPFLILLTIVLAFTVSLNTVSATSVDPDFKDKYNALEKSGFYNPETNKILLSEETAKSYYDFSNEELNVIKTHLANLTDKEISNILELNNIDPDAIDANTETAHANWVWLIPVGIGLILAGGIIFSAMYFSHKEKMTLINKCYDKGGSPKVSSKDKAGLNGTTNSGAAEQAGGYKFECVK